MTEDSKKPPKRDPFAPLPLPETLTGKSPIVPEPAPPVPPEEQIVEQIVEAPIAEPPAPQPPAAAPLPPTAFTSRVTGEHEAPVVPFDASSFQTPETRRESVPETEAAWTEPAALVVENELRDAVGATLLDEDKKKNKAKKKRATTDRGDGDGNGGDEDEDRPRKLWMLVAAIAVVVGGGITAMALVGRSNSERFVIACEADRVVVLQGRSFPPWGESSLEGAEWKPLKIPAEALCTPFETENKAELAAKFGRMLEERATKLVGGRGGTSTPTTAADPEDPVAMVDEAEAALKQALLVSRWLSADQQLTKRDDLERLLGDVTYWRASARLRAAADALADAAKQFDAASLQKPRTNTDAAGWAMHARRLADQLRAGPGGESPAMFPPMPPTEPTSTSTTTNAPPGVALPVEPPSAGSADEPAPPPIDAGAPGGGVLL